MDECERLIKLIFLCYLFVSAWEDMKTKTIDSRIFLVFGLMGLILRSWKMIDDVAAEIEIQAQRGRITLIIRETLPLMKSMGIGMALLAVSAITKGCIGEGDGWFFLIAGMYLSFRENMGLLLSGLLFAGIAGMILFIRGFWNNTNMRKATIPFIAFLLPAGMWMLKELIL